MDPVTERQSIPLFYVPDGVPDVGEPGLREDELRAELHNHVHVVYCTPTGKPME